MSQDILRTYYHLKLIEKDNFTKGIFDKKLRNKLRFIEWHYQMIKGVNISVGLTEFLERARNPLD